MQQRYADEPWKLLVCCVLLNQTHRRQVDRVLEELFERYPDCLAMAMADEDELADAVRSTGFARSKARRLVELSSGWAVSSSPIPPESYVAGLAGVGPYALDSYRIFVLGDTSRCDSRDKELLAWARENGVDFDEEES